MWARSQTNGLISGLCWRVSSGSSISVSCRVRIRDRSSPARASSMQRVAMSGTGFFSQDGERAGVGGACAHLVARRAAAHDQFGVGLDVGFQRRGAVAGGDVDTALYGRAQGRIGESDPGGDLPGVADRLAQL